MNSMRQRVSLVAAGTFGIACFLLGVTWARNWSAAVVGSAVYIGTFLLLAVASSVSHRAQDERWLERLRDLCIQHAVEKAKLRCEVFEERKARLLEAHSRDSIIEALGDEDDG